LNDALDRLDDEKRSVFVLYEIEELSMAEIAHTLACPLQTAYSRLYAARESVHRALRTARHQGGTPMVRDDSPERLANSSTPAAGAVRAARDDLPSEARMSVLAAALAIKIAGVASATGVGAAGGSAAGAGTGSAAGGAAPTAVGWFATIGTTQVGAALGLGAVVVAGTLWLTLAATEHPPAPETAGATTGATAATGAAVAAADVSPAALPELRPSAPDVPPASALPTARPAAPAASARAAASASSPSPNAATASDAKVEMDLLRKAQTELTTDPKGALATCDEHARRFPRGALAQERDVLAIDALVQLGRKTEAASRAAQFVARYPGSAYRARIEAIAAGAPDAPAKHPN
jgi:hypothetical protein